MLLIDFFGLLFLKVFTIHIKENLVKFNYLLLEDSEVGEESPSLDLV